MKRKKRVGPPPVDPVVRDGIRYEALTWGKERDLGQNGGYIIAFDESSGRELWLQKVYDVVYDGGMDSDKQDVFITEMALDGSGGRLLIENERGARFTLCLSDRSVEAL